MFHPFKPVCTLALFLFSAFLLQLPLTAHLPTVTTSSITFEDDAEYTIEFTFPSHWIEVEDNAKEDQLYDYKFRHEDSEREAMIFIGKSDEVIVQDDLSEAVDTLIQEYYRNQERTGSYLALSSNQCVHTFQINQDNKPLFVTLFIYSYKQYIFGIVIESSNMNNALSDDVNTFVRNIKIVKQLTE